MSNSSSLSIKNDAEDSDSSNSEKIELKNKEPVKKRESSSSSSEDEKAKVVISNRVAVTEKVEISSVNQKTVEISINKEEKPSLLKPLVNKNETKPKSIKRSVSANKTIKESGDENKETKSKNSWERSTRIDKKLNEIYYMSALHGNQLPIDEKPPMIVKKKPKKPKRKTVDKDKKLSRSVSAELVSKIKADNKSIKKRKDSSSSEYSEDKSKSTISEKKVKTKRNSISSTQSQDLLARKPPLLFPEGKVQHDDANKNEKERIALNSSQLANKTSSRRRVITREVLEFDVHREYRPKIDSHAITHHFFHKEDEQQYFVRALKKDISTYLNAKLKEDRFRVLYREFADKKPKYNYDFEVPLLYKQGINNKRWVTGQRFHSVDINLFKHNKNDDDNDEGLYLNTTSGCVPIEKYFYKK